MKVLIGEIPENPCEKCIAGPQSECKSTDGTCDNYQDYCRKLVSKLIEVDLESIGI